MSAGATDPVLVVDQVSKSFPGVRALDRVGFDLRRGEVHVLVGENGAGKSTLIKVLAGIHRPDSGTIRIDGRPVLLRSPQDAQRLGIATIHQESMLFPDLSVAENIAVGRLPCRAGAFVDLARMRRRAEAALSQLGAALDVRVPANRLTVAQKKLVEIARALSWDARLIILDEPTAAMHEEEVGRLFAVLRGLRGHGVSIVYISHRLVELAEFGDRVTVLRDGRAVGTLAAAGLDQDELIQLMVGREVNEMFPPRAGSLGGNLLTVEGLTRRGSFEDVTLHVRTGEIVGVAGLLGSGRSDLLLAIGGALPHDAGRVHVQGRITDLRSPTAAIRAGLALLPADRKTLGVILPMSVAGNVTLAGLKSLTRRGLIEAREEAEAVRGHIRRLQVRPGNPMIPVRNLSGGNQQKVLLARALQSGARVLLLDEPTVGLDVGARAEIYQLLRELVQQGKGVLVASADLAELQGLCDRIAVMRDGRVGGWFIGRDVTQEALLRCAIGRGAA